jgi:putative flippase GtrA
MLRDVDRGRLGVESAAVELGRILRFGLVGILASVIYFASTTAFFWLGAGPLASTAMGQFVSALFSYFGHRYFSFMVTRESNYVLRFAALMLLNFLLSVGIIWTFTEWLHLSYVTAVATVSVVVPVVNYLGNRFWVFLPGLVRRFQQ